MENGQNMSGEKCPLLEVGRKGNAAKHLDFGFENGYIINTCTHRELQKRTGAAMFSGNAVAYLLHEGRTIGLLYFGFGAVVKNNILLFKEIQAPYHGHTQRVDDK